MPIQITNHISCETTLFHHFQNTNYLYGLIQLYQASQYECCRLSGLTPEIGSSRERDLISSMKSNPSLRIKYLLPYEVVEDVICNDKKISIKHSSNKKNHERGIKVVWTVEEEKRKEYMENIDFEYDLMIIYIRFEENDIENGEMEIFYMEEKTLQEEKKKFQEKKEEILKCPQGNSRGIEFHKNFFSSILQNSLFHIQIQFQEIRCDTCDPIKKRLKLLHSIYQQLEEDKNEEEEDEKPKTKKRRRS